MNVHHCVFFTFRKEVTSNERQSIYAELAAVGDLIEGMEAFTAGPNTSFEGMERGYHDGFVMRFRDRNAHMAYHDHDAHKKAGGRLVDAVIGGIDGIFVFDFEAA